MDHARNFELPESPPAQVGSPLQGGRFPTGVFRNAHHFVVKNPTLIDLQSINNYYGKENALERLAPYTIPGAEFDSSARSPPPLCHPNTRLDILRRVEDWFHHPKLQKPVLWICGPAGVGKSAILQTLAESVSECGSNPTNFSLGATLFFSKINHRNNPYLVFNTIAFQLAVHHSFYRDYITKELAIDPKLMEKAMKEQFRRLIVKPFAEKKIYQGPGSLLILVDGLDECKGEREQCEIVMLIASFVTQYPTAPLLWVISSRPESHLKTLFSRQSVQPVYWKEDILIDSDDACKDVEQYLRGKFEEIELNHPASFPVTGQWPTESQFLKITAAASGLFAFAATVIRYVDDLEYGNPVSQLARVLLMIDKAGTSAKSDGRLVNPLAALDSLYTQILSSIPKDVLPMAARILSHVSHIPFVYPTLVLLSNFLGLEQHDTYGALQKLHSVVRIPHPESAQIEAVMFYHASFSEYLNDAKRSKEYSITQQECMEDRVRCNLRILRHASNISLSKVQLSDIVLSWPVLEPEHIQRHLYRKAISWFPTDFGEASEELQCEELPSVIHICKILDFGDLDVPEIDCSRFILEIQETPTLRDELTSHKIMRMIPVGAIRKSHIDMEKSTYAYCEQIGERSVADGRGFDFVYEDGYYTHRGETPDRLELVEHRFRHAMGPLRSESMASVLPDLEYVQTHSPSTSVVAFGVGSKTIVLFERELVPGVQIWRYVIPYPQL